MDNTVREKLTSWVEKVFKNEHLDEVLEVKFPNFDSSGGYAAEMIFATVTGEKSGKKKTYDIIIKKGKDGIAEGPLNYLAQAYANENNVYSKFLPYFDKFAKERNVAPFEDIPFCYGTIDSDNQFGIILKNLKLEGFDVHNVKIPMDKQHMNIVIDAYAKWHAMSFALKDQQPEVFEKFGKCNNAGFDPQTLDMLTTRVQKELDLVIEMYGGRNEPNVVKKLEIIKAESPDMMKKNIKCEEEYVVIRHGDCWNNNFLFHYNENSIPDKVAVIDWQLSFLGSPLSDLAQVLFYCCSRTELVHLDDIMQRYYNLLSKTLRELGSDPEKCFPWKSCLDAFKKSTPFAMMAMPLFVRMSYKVETDEAFDIASRATDKEMGAIFGEKLRDPEEYFNRISGNLELCIERGLL